MYAINKRYSLKHIMTFVAAASMLFVFTPQTASAAGVGATCLSNANCDSGLTCKSLSGSTKKTCVSSTTSGSKTTDTFGLTKVNKGLNDSLGNTGLQETIGNIINVALSLLGVVSVVIILIGGFKWMTAGGSEEKVDEARKQIMQGIVGLAIILSAWAITIFVLQSLSKATGSGDTGGFQTS